MRSFGPNVVSFTVILGWKRWYIVREYVPPNDLPTVQRITQALSCGPDRVGKLLVGDLNACMDNPRDQREEYLATVLSGYGLTYHTQHFVPRRRYRAEENWMWRMWTEGIPILGRGEYILGTTQQDFSMVGIREPRMPTEHQMVLRILIGEGVR